MRTSIVIPQYKHYALTHQLLFDLYKFCREDIDEVLIVDDDSDDDEIEDGLRWWYAQKMLPLKVVWRQENQGFLKTSNLGMKKAEGDVLILISTDVRVRSNFVKQIKDALESDKKLLIGNRLIAFDTGWNTFDGVTYPYLEGWLLACTKEAWEELGGFDERYAPNDMEDIDIATTARMQGYTLISLDDSNVYHIGGQTLGFNPAREAITKANKEKFREKWTK